MDIQFPTVQNYCFTIISHSHTLSINSLILALCIWYGINYQGSLYFDKIKKLLYQLDISSNVSKNNITIYTLYKFIIAIFKQFWKIRNRIMATFLFLNR